jgi:hypothetical protein
MNDLNYLRSRIDAEISLQQEKKERLQQERLDAFEQRRNRYRDLYLPVMNRLKAVWHPRLQLLESKFEALAHRFGETVGTTSVTAPAQDAPHSGEMNLVCESPLAKVRLRLSFYHDADIRNVVAEYLLEIVPVFVKFERQSRLETKIESFSEEAVVDWLDNRIVQFFRTYLAIHENSAYLADLVEDSIAKVRFQKCERCEKERREHLLLQRGV